MADHIYKTVELTGSSPVGIDDAVRNAVAKASETIHNLRWVEVTEIRGHVDGAKVEHWQVTIKLGFTID